MSTLRVRLECGRNMLILCDIKGGGARKKISHTKMYCFC